jgi:transglutaminase-like putative cysteine protease
MARRGNPDNLRAAAQRKHQAAVARAERALHALVRSGEPVSFRGVARLADCSPDFLYRTPQLRDRIEQLRAQPRCAAAPEPPSSSTSAVVRELAAQLADEKRGRREEVAALEAALAMAHGELLALRRQLAGG